MNKRKRLRMDYLNLIHMRIKLIFNNKSTVLTLIMVCILFAVLIHTLSSQIERRSGVPIGIIDEDKSDGSKRLVKQMKENSSIFVYEKNLGLLKKYLRDELVDAIFIIPDGFEEKIKSGNPSGIIDAYYQKENSSGMIISDIVAGEVMYEVCLFKSLQTYKQIPDLTSYLTDEKYIEYTNELKDSMEYQFQFDIDYVDVKNTTSVKENLNNTVIYKQALFGILSILISFVLLFMTNSVVEEYENGVYLRKKIALRDIHIIDFSNLIAIGLISSIMNLYLVGLLKFIMKFESSKDLIMIFLLLNCFSFVVTSFFILISKKIKDVISIQLRGTFLILVLGGLGFLEIFHNPNDMQLLNISKIIPNCLFIKGFTAIILNTDTRNNVFNNNIIQSCLYSYLILFLSIIFLIFAFGRKRK